jgi:type I restriction enzyme R subunit
MNTESVNGDFSPVRAPSFVYNRAHQVTRLETPEKQARQRIDAALMAAGWQVQSRDAVNLHADRGVAVREFRLNPGHGYADYLLYVDSKAIGVIEAKKEGETLTGVEVQAEKYAAGLPEALPAAFRPLPLLYQSTGIETRFTNRFDPHPRSRRVFHFHKPEALADWINMGGVAGAIRPPTLRSRLRGLPPLPDTNLWAAQIKAITRLEESLSADRPRALIQMATGSGKTYTAVTATYRMVKFGGAKRVLFLVDRANLGRQALTEFQQFATPDDGRKFTELYNVQLLSSNRVDPVARVVITTIQRLYSMLKGDAELDPELDEKSGFDTLAGVVKEPVPVGYNPAIPVEFFDIMFIDECHRSIYSLWRQVLEYFDAHLIGLTATPSKQTFGFFNQNLVMEYGHKQAVADGVNVDFDVYRIRTKITEQGATVEAGPFEVVGRRDRLTRALRWEQLDQDLTYSGDALDRAVVAEDQIRTVVRAFRDRLFTEIYPGRTEVPKTLIYAKDDSHADDIVQIVREEFGKGNDFCEKITYKTGTARVITKTVGPDGKEVERITYKSTGVKPEDLLSSFRNSYNPRIVVTVDMIATGTDIKPLEIVMFMRSVKSRNFFEQMKGRGVRVINRTDLIGVTPDAKAKDHFVIVDCVGVTEHDLSDTYPLDQKHTVPLKTLLDQVALGSTDADVLSAIAGRLARMDRLIGEPERDLIRDAGGTTLKQLTERILEALDPDRQVEAARTFNTLPADTIPTDAQVADAAKQMIAEAVRPLASNPTLRTRLVDLKRSLEQTYDKVSQDAVLEAGYSDAAKDRAKSIVDSWEQFIEDNKDEITALQILYSQPRGKIRFRDLDVLAKLIQAPPRAWTPDLLWSAYEKLERDKVKGVGSARLLTDIVSLVRFALHQEDALVPYPVQVQERFGQWLAQQESAEVVFTPEQRQWLELIRDHVAASMGIEMDDFEYAPFAQKGGAGRAYQVFGDRLEPLLNELNGVLAA